MTTSDILDVLNLLTAKRNQLYYVWATDSNTIHFSNHIKKVKEFFLSEKTVYKLTEWQQVIDPRDYDYLVTKIEKLVKRKTDSYNFNYRVQGYWGESIWVNDNGRFVYGENGALLYTVGCMMLGEDTKPGETVFHNHELKKEIDEILHTGQQGYLLFIGIDNLKMINLKNGRDFGDEILRTVTQSIETELPSSQKVFRINGDWFAVNLFVETEKEVARFFERVQARLFAHCTVSGGCVSFTDYHVDNAGTLLQYAETSLDYSKNHGKNRLTFFSPENYEERLRELELREDLKKSIETDFAGFSLVFQGQYYTETYELYGAEALLRYQSPRRGNISPVEFVPLLEKSNMMYPVGLWVIREALKYCRQWREKQPHFHISVNMSYRQLADPSIEEDVLELLQNSGVPGSALTIEVTESMELSNYPQLNGIFRRWKKSGIEISVDDFGTGYSSLGRLKDLAVDEIKIDRCFVRGIQESAYNYRLLSNIIALADSSQIRVCCEGVESKQELAVLKELNPFLLQGYLLAKPCDAGQFRMDSIENASSRQRKKELCITSTTRPAVIPMNQDGPADEIAQTILNAENDIFYLSDLDTYELYYLNQAGQKIFGVKDYFGKKCYKVLHGKDSPCAFCTNTFLRHDSFYVWENRNEYCGRHFLLKDKIVSYRGRNVRLEVALDITKQEYVSQSAKERLAFAEKIEQYIRLLSDHTSYSKAVNQVLASVGDFYQADRAYMFVPSAGEPGHWDNRFEWCAANVSPQRDNLQKVPPAVLARWMEIFQKGQSVILWNLDPLQAQSPEEWRVLWEQGIQRLIAVPLCENGKIIGFVGVDNPRYCIHDDLQIRVLVSFLLARIHQDRHEHQYQALLQESNQDLLQALHVGFWTMEIDKKEEHHKMIVDKTMRDLLAIPEQEEPEAVYEFWSSRLKGQKVDTVRQAFSDMRDSGQIVQTVYSWNHPVKGWIFLRFSGIFLESTSDFLKFKGYVRQVDDPTHI